MSADFGSRHRVFVGSYGPRDAPTIHICVLDETVGALHVTGSATGITNPSFLVVSASGHHLYAVSETGRSGDGPPGAVHAFRIVTSGADVELVALNHQASGGDHPCHLAIDASGRWLAVSNYGTGSVTVLPIRHDGTLGEIASLQRHDGSGPNVRQDGPHAHAASFSPDGRFLLAADLGIDRVLVSEFHPDSGSLRRHGEAVSRAGAGPRHMAFHPDGAHLFVVNELDNTVTLYDWDTRAGVLRERCTVSTLPPGAPDNIAADVRVSTDGRYVYVSNRGHDSVAVFDFDRSRLIRVAVRSCGGSWPRGLGLGPGGHHLLAANERADAVAVLPLLEGGADLGTPTSEIGIERPTCVAFGARPR